MTAGRSDTPTAAPAAGRQLAHMTLPEGRSLGDRPVILPVGSTEQHGPILPYGTDTIIATGVATRVGAAIGATVLPPIAYGYRSRTSSGGGPLFPGTIDLSGRTLTLLVHDVVAEVLRDGVTDVLVLSAHFENDAFIQEALELVGQTLEPGSPVRLIATNWWDPIPPEVIASVFTDLEFPGWDLEHAGVTETSLLLALAPELVDLDHVAATDVEADPLHYFRVPVQADDAPEQGNLSSARGSSAEIGEVLLDAAAAGIERICRTEMG